VSRYQTGKTNLDFTGARDSEWQWHQLGHVQVCTSLQTDNHASTSLLSFLQAGCPSCHPTNSVKALKANKEIVRSLHKNKANWTTQNCNKKHYSSLKKRISVTKVNNIMTVNTSKQLFNTLDGEM